jgi:hypothetical protein
LRDGTDTPEPVRDICIKRDFLPGRRQGTCCQYVDNGGFKARCSIVPSAPMFGPLAAPWPKSILATIMVTAQLRSPASFGSASMLVQMSKFTGGYQTVIL